MATAIRTVAGSKLAFPASSTRHVFPAPRWSRSLLCPFAMCAYVEALKQKEIMTGVPQPAQD